MKKQPLSNQVLPDSLSWKEHVLIIGIAFFSLIIHSRFMIRGFGEVDSCTLAVYVLRWHHLGEFTGYSDVIRTCTFYLQYLRITLDLGLPPSSLPDFMNWTNVVAGSLCLIPLYYLCRQFTTIGTTLMFFLFLSFAPAFWLGNIYGMSHIPGLFFFLISLNSFGAALKKTGITKTVYFVFTFIFAVLTLGFKADLLLCFGSFLGLVLLQNPFRVRHLLYSIALPVFSLVFILVYQIRLFPKLSRINQAASDWNSNFPFTLNALTDSKNIAATVTALGIIMSIMVIAFLFYGILYRKNIRMLLFVLCWALPLALFWGLRMGNSARHMLSPLIPLLLYATLLIPSIFKKWHLQWLFVFLILIANYYVCPDSQLPRTVRPSSRIFLACTYLHRQVSLWHQAGKDFARFDAEKKMIIGNDYVNYPAWEVLKTLKSLNIDQSNAIVITQNGTPQYVKVFHSEMISKTTLDSFVTNNPEWSIWKINTLHNSSDFTLECIQNPQIQPVTTEKQ